MDVLVGEHRKEEFLFPKGWTRFLKCTGKSVDSAAIEQNTPAF